MKKESILDINVILKSFHKGKKTDSILEIPRESYNIVTKFVIWILSLKKLNVLRFFFRFIFSIKINNLVKILLIEFDRGNRLKRI